MELPESSPAEGLREGIQGYSSILDGSGSLVSSNLMQLEMEEDSSYGAGHGSVAHK